jgi:hypothetical protein
MGHRRCRRHPSPQLLSPSSPSLHPPPPLAHRPRTLPPPACLPSPGCHLRPMAPPAPLPVAISILWCPRPRHHRPRSPPPSPSCGAPGPGALDPPDHRPPSWTPGVNTSPWRPRLRPPSPSTLHPRLRTEDGSPTMSSKEDKGETDSN